MRDAFVIFRKEAKEMTGDRSSLRGTLTQALVIVAVCGLLVPFKTPDILESVESSVMLFIVFPMTLAAAVAADAFAGERERGTLETLFASPLSESESFSGRQASLLRSPSLFPASPQPVPWWLFPTPEVLNPRPW